MGVKWTEQDASAFKEKYGRYPSGYQAPKQKTATPSRTPAKDKATNMLYENLMKLAEGTAPAESLQAAQRRVDTIRDKGKKDPKKKKGAPTLQERQNAVDAELMKLIDEKAATAKTGYRDKEGEPQLGYGDMEQDDYETKVNLLDQKIAIAKETSDRLHGRQEPRMPESTRQYLEQPSGLNLSDRIKSILGIDPQYQSPGPEMQAPADLYIQSVRTPEEYNSLAPGAFYYDPQGVKRRKAGAR